MSSRSCVRTAAGGGRSVGDGDERRGARGGGDDRGGRARGWPAAAGGRGGAARGDPGAAAARGAVGHRERDALAAAADGRVVQAAAVLRRRALHRRPDRAAPLARRRAPHLRCAFPPPSTPFIRLHFYPLCASASAYLNTHTLLSVYCTCTVLLFSSATSAAPTE